MATETRSPVADEIVLPVQPAASRWWIVPLLFLLALFLIVAMAAAIVLMRLQFDKRAARQAVEDEVARIQAAGEPITIDDLYAFHQVPEGVRDTTSLWLAALNSFREQQIVADGKGLPFVGELTAEHDSRLRPEAPDSLLPEAEAFLQKYDATREATLAAARAGGECRFPVEFEKGIGMLLTHAQQMRSLARLLVLNAHVQAARGDANGAVESIEAMIAASEALSHESTLVGYLVRLALLNMAVHETNWLVNETQLTGEQLARLEQKLRAADIRGGLTTGLYGERAMNYYTFHHLETIQTELPFKMTSNGKLTRPADCLLSLELLGATIEASREPFPAAQQGVENVNNRLRSVAGSGNPLDKWNHMITLLMTPAVGSSFEATARSLASREALLAAIAAERFRLEKGSFPTQLTDLVPAYLPQILLDPFDGRPLRLIASEKELTIYSIGRNKIDDGGSENQRSGFPEDIVIRVRAEKGRAP